MLMTVFFVCLQGLDQPVQLRQPSSADLNTPRIDSYRFSMANLEGECSARCSRGASGVPSLAPGDRLPHGPPACYENRALKRRRQPAGGELPPGGGCSRRTSELICVVFTAKYWARRGRENMKIVFDGGADNEIFLPLTRITEEKLDKTAQHRHEGAYEKNKIIYWGGSLFARRVFFFKGVVRQDTCFTVRAARRCVVAWARQAEDAEVHSGDSCVKSSRPAGLSGFSLPG